MLKYNAIKLSLNLIASPWSRRNRRLKMPCVDSLRFCFSALFPDVVNCMQTDNLELKKLVYLYLMNYAKSQPDLAIMAVNTFVKVSVDSF